MKKAVLLKIVNLLLGVSILIQLVTGFFRSYLPPELFFRVHSANAVPLAILIVLHLSLNWNWIKSMFFTRKK